MLKTKNLFLLRNKEYITIAFQTDKIKTLMQNTVVQVLGKRLKAFTIPTNTNVEVHLYAGKK